MAEHTGQGWRIAPKPGAQLRRTEAGRFALPLIITFDGEQCSEIEYVYTGSQIEDLYRQMGELIAEGAPKREHYPAQREDRRAQAAEMGAFYG